MDNNKKAQLPDVIIYGSGPELAEAWTIIQNRLEYGLGGVVKFLALVPNDPAYNDCFPGLPRFETIAKALSAYPEAKLVLNLSNAVIKCTEVSEKVNLITLDMAKSMMFSSIFLSSLGDEWNPNRFMFPIAMSQFMAEAIIIVDKEGIIVDLNQKTFDFAKTRSDHILGTKINELFPGLDVIFHADGEEAALFPFTLSTGMCSETIISAMDLSGFQHQYRILLSPVFNIRKEVTHVVIVGRDITTGMFLGHKKRIIEKFEAVEELSMYLAHELRNPLFVISGFTNTLLKKENLSPEAVKKLSIILEESERMNNILKVMDQIATPEELRFGDSDLREALEETLQEGDLKEAIKKEQVDVSVNVDAKLPRVGCHPETLKACLKNIITNALEAMRDQLQGEKKLVVRGKMQRGYIMVSITDTGEGIAPENMSKIFNPFYSTRNKGSGLGLLTTRNLLEEMNGKIEISSTLNEGTEVSIYLPPLQAGVTLKCLEEIKNKSKIPEIAEKEVLEED